MEYCKDAEIFIIAHRPVEYGIWSDYFYTPIQVGSAETFLETRDNTGDNIAQWNPVFAENTAHYWIAHNVDKKYIGVCQFRRRLHLLPNTDFENIFNTYYAIAPTPLKIGDTVRHQYEMCHCAEDMNIVETIVKSLYPELNTAWNKIINNGHTLFYSSSVVMKAEDFREYVDFLYTVGCEYLKYKNLQTPEDVREMVEQDISVGKRPNANGGHKEEGAVKYQTQIMGFMAERLLTLWLLKDNKPILTIPYTKFENV